MAVCKREGWGEKAPRCYLILWKYRVSFFYQKIFLSGAGRRGSGLSSPGLVELLTAFSGREVIPVLNRQKRWAKLSRCYVRLDVSNQMLSWNRR